MGSVFLFLYLFFKKIKNMIPTDACQVTEGKSLPVRQHGMRRSESESRRARREKGLEQPDVLRNVNTGLLSLAYRVQ